MEIHFETKKGDVVDLTERVQEVVNGSGVREGIVNVFAPHATGVLFLGEYERLVNMDYLDLLESLVPEGKGWNHDRIDDNAHAHLRSMLVGSGVTVPVSGARLLLGTWQRIIFVETDGTRRRRVIVTVVGK